MIFKTHTPYYIKTFYRFFFQNSNKRNKNLLIASFRLCHTKLRLHSVFTALLSSWNRCRIAGNFLKKIYNSIWNFKSENFTALLRRTRRFSRAPAVRQSSNLRLAVLSLSIRQAPTTYENFLPRVHGVLSANYVYETFWYIERKYIKYNVLYFINFVYIL